MRPIIKNKAKFAKAFLPAKASAEAGAEADSSGKKFKKCHGA